MPDTSEHLCQLVEVLDASHRKVPNREASLVRVAGLGGDDTVDLALTPVASREVYENLVGTTLPEPWEATGFVVHGTARSMSGSAAARVPGAKVGDAMVVALLARDGSLVSSLRLDGGDPVVRVGRVDDGDDRNVGRLVDALCRSVGLASAPPRVDIHLLTISLWLHRIHAEVLDAAPVDRCVIDLLAPSTPSSWEQLREQCAEGRWPELGIAPSVAAWMDAGMFARAAVGAFPEPIEVMIDLYGLLDQPVWTHLIAALSRVGN